MAIAAYGQETILICKEISDTLAVSVPPILSKINQEFFAIATPVPRLSRSRKSKKSGNTHSFSFRLKQTIFSQILNSPADVRNAVSSFWIKGFSDTTVLFN